MIMPGNHKLTRLLVHMLSIGSLLPQAVLGDLDGHCPPLGPVLPAPTSPSANSAVQSAVAGFSETFTSITGSFASSAVSLSVRSIHERGAGLLDLHHTPPDRRAGSTASVDGNTVYRVGSVSKVFTVLGILRIGIRFDDPVTLYLPELRGLGAADGMNNDISAVAWDDITIGALASHMSGIGLDLMFDLANIPQPWATLGFPTLNDTSDTPGCEGLHGLPPCPESELYRDLGKHHPVYGAFTTPMYSDLGAAILGLVLERVSNVSYADFTQDAILTPLGLENTTLTTLSIPQNAFIPNQAEDEDWWGADLGWNVPAGGFYSTANDLLSFGTAILNNSVLSSAATRKWLKPVSSTSSVGRGMGAPWEILRTTNLTTDNRLIEIYTKGGDAGTYHTKLVLVPDYDLVIAILTAGPEAPFELSFTLLSQLLTALLPALEQAGQSEVIAAGMTGAFTSTTSDDHAHATTATTSGTDANANADAFLSSISLSLDDGPGLAISAWTVRGQDVGALYASDAVAGVGAGTVVRPRLYPTDLRWEDSSGDDGAGATTTRWAWRAVFDTGTAAEAVAFDAGFAWPGQSCQTWANMDRFPYGFRGIDDFVFTLVEGGDGGGLFVQSLENRGFRVVMEKS